MVIGELLKYHRSDYQRDNFDKFLKKVSFSYDVPSIHIAGTNGKGSTANYIASIYQKAGYRVGLFTSPSYIDSNDMITINGQAIEDKDVLYFFDRYQKYIDKYELSEFEVTTFVALNYLQNKKVDIAIIECGMGGALDATTIFTPILSIITTVSMEHTSFLGSSIYEIATHKAGIIAEEVPTLIGELVEEAESTIAEIANENDSKLTKVGPTFNIKELSDGISFNYLNYQDVKLSSSARFSCYDASLAIEATIILKDQFPIKDEDIFNGLASVKMPARLEELSSHPLLIVDGAHNIEAIAKLAESIYSRYPTNNIHVVFASFKDKNISLMLPEIAKVGIDLTLTTFNHSRARNEEDYFLYNGIYPFEIDHISLINSLMKEHPDDTILVTGSLAFAYLVRDEFKKGTIKYEPVLDQE